MKADTDRADKITQTVTHDDASAVYELAHTWSGYTDGDETHKAMNTAISDAIAEIRLLREQLWEHEQQGDELVKQQNENLRLQNNNIALTNGIESAYTHLDDAQRFGWTDRIQMAFQALALTY